MSLVNTETGEVVEPLSEGDAERLSTRIRLRLDTIADNYTAVMPLIREALTRQAHTALGYRSPGDYVSDRFGDALSKLGVDVRREVVRELTDAGMSTRAIAPVVGTSQKTVSRDQQVSQVTHLCEVPDPRVDPQGALDAAIANSEAIFGGQEPATPAATVTGIDGKAYPRPAPSAPKAPPRRALTDQFFDAAYDMTKAVERVSRLAGDDRFPQNAEKVAAKHRNDLLRTRDLLEQVINSLPEQESTP